MIDREAAVRQVAEARFGPRDDADELLYQEVLREAEREAEDWWPLICQAREDGPGAQ